MRLKLETFEKMAVLLCSGTVTLPRARVLVAGVKKVASLRPGWVLIDLSRAHLEAPAERCLLDFIAEIDQDPKVGRRIRWTGCGGGIGQFEDLAEALEALKIPELRPLSQKIELEENLKTLRSLLAARAQVRSLLEGGASSLKELEAEFTVRNRTIRSSQTRLINRILDPVFSDLPEEGSLGDEEIARLTAVFGPAPQGELPENSPVQDQSSPQAQDQALDATGLRTPRFDYTPANLSALIQQLKQELKQLSLRSSEPFIEGADRMVSLVMENVALRERVDEASRAWLEMLAGDARLTPKDFELGYRSLIEAAEEEAKAQEEAKNQPEEVTRGKLAR